MSRAFSTETFQMDVRSQSQQNLDPLNSRSSSLTSQPQDANDSNQENGELMMNQRKHKLDLYSIPVFLLEVLILCGLAYFAHFIHFQYHHDSYVDGFYCDDIALRQNYDDEDAYIQWFNQKQKELTFVLCMLVVPVVLIIFCELVNSMFGALKFRQVRALCKCCKLHSITRRSIRFSGAFILGFLICMISCDILATTSGRLRPFFAQECTTAYQQCLAPSTIRDLNSAPPARPLSPPISTLSATLNDTLINSLPAQPAALSRNMRQAGYVRIKRDLSATDTQQSIPALLERRWIHLAGQDLKEVCKFSQQHDSDTPDAIYKFDQLAKSWPSFPAAIFTYSCLYLACYLCFVGTARPFRMISSLIVVFLLLVSTAFDVQLVKLRYNHWEDVVAGAVLALMIVIFVLLVYLNRFKDTHYYENQKLFSNRSSSSRQIGLHESFKNYSGDGTTVMGNYSLDKTFAPSASNLNNGAIVQNNNLGETGGSVSNNDLAMRYFQIPRANYRGAPRPISSLQQMRS